MPIVATQRQRPLQHLTRTGVLRAVTGNGAEPGQEQRIFAVCRQRGLQRGRGRCKCSVRITRTGERGLHLAAGAQQRVDYDGRNGVMHAAQC
ncbi:hypothetical protein D3C81_1737420 [compost metagenome]